MSGQKQNSYLPNRDWDKWLKIVSVVIALLALIIGSASLSWKVYIDLEHEKANLEVLKRRVFYANTIIGSQILNTQDESQDNKTKLILILRNLSSRPTGIIDIYLREKNGDIIGGSGYHDQIMLPIKIDGWGLHKLIFCIEKRDENRIYDILIRDIDDNEIIVEYGGNTKWIRKRLRE